MPHEFTSATVRQLRADFLLLMRNADLVKDWAAARSFQLAVRRFHDHVERLVYREVLPALKARHGDGHVARDIASGVWQLLIELSVPLENPRADDTAHRVPSSEAAFERYLARKDKWLSRVKSKARGAWAALGSYFEYVNPDALTYTPEIQDQLELAGFRVTVKDPPPERAARYVERIEEGLRHFRQRASRVFPWMVARALPFIVDFKAEDSAAGTYNHGASITLNGWWASRPTPADTAQIIAHEMAHHVWEGYLSGPSKDFWTEALRADYGELDLGRVLELWPPGQGSYWIVDHPLREKEPLLYLQIYMCIHPPLDDLKWFETRGQVEALVAEGKRTVPVPRNPITVYARKNPEEAFCEALSHLVAYGPGALLPTVRWWLREILPNLKVASGARVPNPARVAAAFLTRSS